MFSLLVPNDSYLPLSRSLFRNDVLYYNLRFVVLFFSSPKNGIEIHYEKYEIFQQQRVLEFWLIQVRLHRAKFRPISRINSNIASQPPWKKIFDETQIDLLQQILIIFRNQLGPVLILRFLASPCVRENNFKVFQLNVWNNLPVEFNYRKNRRGAILSKWETLDK